MTATPCPELLEAGYTVEAVAALHTQGLCTHQAPATPAIPPIQNDVSGAGIPLPMLAIGGIALVTWLLEKASDYGRNQQQQQHLLPGAHIGQQALYPAEPAHENPVTPGVPVGSGSKTGETGSEGFGLTEPIPWGMSEAEKDAYKEDRTGSDTSTADLWAVLKDCSFTEFQKRIRPGNIDPVPVVNDGMGAIAAGEALYRWFQHNITQQNKCCFAAFGTDGKGGGATAKAAVQLYKEHLSEWSSIAVRG